MAALIAAFALSHAGGARAQDAFKLDFQGSLGEGANKHQR